MNAVAYDKELVHEVSLRVLYFFFFLFHFISTDLGFQDSQYYFMESYRIPNGNSCRRDFCLSSVHVI